MSNNDTNTLNGALQELGETMAANLVTQGVQASASDGLTTLAGKILDIQAGGSCYHIEFSESSYTATGGSATLEIFLQENYAPKSGATVTVTGSDSSLYTGITNSSGTASVTVSNISSETTFTASYSGATATCTVTVQSYLFYDDCSSSSGLTNYGNVIIGEGSSTAYSLTYDSGMNAYKVSHSAGNTKMINIPLLDNQDNFTIELDFYYPTNATNIIHTGIGIANSTTVFTGIGTLYDNGWYSGNSNYNNKSWGSWGNKTSIANPTQQWNHLKITVQDKAVNVVMTINNTDYTYNKTLSNSFTSKQFGILIQGGATSLYAYVRNIKAEAL